MPQNILLVEDDPILGRSVVINLEAEGYDVKWAQSLKAANAHFESLNFSLIILDLNLPDGDGIQFCKEVRKDGFLNPILMLTARADEASVVAGLTSGANDYVRKPFGMKELLARVSNLSEKLIQEEKTLNMDEIRIDPTRREVLIHNKSLSLRRREFDLLRLFVERSGHVLTRETLIQALGTDEAITDRTIDSHISHLRSKLKNAGLKSYALTSIYGVGYQLTHSKESSAC